MHREIHAFMDGSLVHASLARDRGVWKRVRGFDAIVVHEGLR